MSGRHRRPSAPDSSLLAAAIEIWTQSSVALIDVRHHTLDADNPLRAYRMPGSMFICSYGGSAEVRLNGNQYSVERFGVFHGGKGTELSVLPSSTASVGCYLLYYKAEEPSFYKKELKRLFKLVNPFQELYGFAPRNPLYIVEQFGSLHERWRRPAPLARLYGKTAFGRLVYAIYEELEQGEVDMLQPDVVALVKRHMDEHFREQVSLRDIAGMFHVSAGHLSRLFKKQERLSPQEYLINKRMEAAKAHLRRSDATLREIAWSCGFSDEFNLIKMFKSHVRMTPGDFRKMSSIRLPDCAIGGGPDFPYAEKGLATLDHSTEEGEYTMLGANRSKTLLMAAALSVTLMLSACSSATAPMSPGGGANAPSGANNPPAVAQQTEAATKEFEHTGGQSTVPLEPQRIVADWFYGELLALGVRPIGYPEYLLSEYPYVEPQGTEGFGEAVEQIVDMNPDLIISTWEDSYTQYSKIAPSVLLKLNDGLIDKMRVLGELVNKQEEAEKWIVSFDEKLQAARQRLAEHTDPDTTVTILGIFQKDLKVYSNKNMGGDVLYNLLQVKPPQKVQEMISDSEVWNQTVSFEALPDIAGTHIILTAYDPEGSGRETLEQLEQSQIWNSLDAVQNNRVHKLGYYDLFFDDPIAIEHQIELLTDMIIAAQ